MELTCKQAAKLVLGYLKSENCMKAHNEFLHSCRHLREVSKKPGKYIATRLQGMDLVEILSDYAKIYTIVQERLEADTDFYKDKNRSGKLVHQLLFLLDNQVPSRCSTPNFMSRCSTPQRSSRQDFHPFFIQPNPEIDATPLTSLPGNPHGKSASPRDKVPSSTSRSNTDTDSDSPPDAKNKEVRQAFAKSLLAQSMLEQQALQEKLADNINKVWCTAAEGQEKAKDGGACDDIESTIKAMLEKTESDPVFDTLMGEIIGSANTVQHFPENNDQFIPSCFDPPPNLQEQNRTLPNLHEQNRAPPNPPSLPNDDSAIKQQQSQTVEDPTVANIPPAITNDIQQQPIDVTDAHNKVPDVTVYEGSLDSYIKSGAGESPLSGNAQRPDSGDGQNKKQQGKQLVFIKLSEADIITMPTVIVCDDKAKNKRRPLVKKVQTKQSKLPQKGQTLSDFVKRFKGNDDDGEGAKPPEVKTLKTMLPKKKMILTRIEPPKIEVLANAKLPHFTPAVSNSMPLIQNNNQFSPAAYEPPITSTSDAATCDVNQIQNNLSNNTIYSSTDSQIVNQTQTADNPNQIVTSTNQFLKPSSNCGQAQMNLIGATNDVNQGQDATNNINQDQNSNNADILSNDANQVTNSMFPLNNDVFASHEMQNNFFSTSSGKADLQAPTSISNHLVPLNQHLQAVQNQSNLLKSIQNQNDLIQSAQNETTDQTSNELANVNVRTDVTDATKSTKETKTENEVKKKEITPADKPEKKRSTSTPRSGNKSHVRALDFKFHTPAKDMTNMKASAASPVKKKSPAKAKTAKSLFPSPPTVKKKKPVGSWDAELRAVTCEDPAVKNAPPKPRAKPKPRATRQSPKPKNKKQAAKKNNSKSEESGSNDKAETDRPAKRAKGKPPKSPQKVITVTTDPHNKECVSIVESEGKVEDLLESEATNPENQAHSQISLIRCNSKPRYNRKCNIDNPTRRELVEEIKFVTPPEFVHPKSTVKKNIMPMLETPVKDCPKTPLPCSPEDTPFTKVLKESINYIDLNNIQTPKFLDTPSFALTPLLEGKSPHSHRGTDYSTSSSYYQPSDTERDKNLESYIKEECRRVQKRITPIKVDVPMDLETNVNNSVIHTNESVCNKMQKLGNPFIAQKNLSLVPKITKNQSDSSDDSSSEDTNSTDSSHSSSSTSSEDENKTSRDSSFTRYLLRAGKANSSKDLSEPPVEDIKSILSVTEYKPVLSVANVEDAEAKSKANADPETKRKEQVLAEMEIKRRRTIDIFKNGSGKPPPPAKKAPAKPKKAPAKKTLPVRRNLRSSAKKTPTPVSCPKDKVRLTVMGLGLTSSDEEDDLKPLKVVEKPLASFEQKKDLSDKQDDSEVKQKELPIKTNSFEEEDAQNLVEGLKERGIYLMHNKANVMEAATKELECEEKLEEGEVVSEDDAKKKPAARKKKLKPAPKIPTARNQTGGNKSKESDVGDKSRKRGQEKNADGENKRRDKSTDGKDKKRDKSTDGKNKRRDKSIDGKNKSRDGEIKNGVKTKESILSNYLKGKSDIEKPRDQGQNKPQAKKVTAQKSEQTRRKSIHLERKIEQLKNIKCEQTKKNSGDEDNVKKPEASDTANKRETTQAAEKKKPPEEEVTSEKKPPEEEETSEKRPPKEEETFDSIDTACGEHVEFDFEVILDVVEYTYDPDEDHRTVTWNKESLYKQRAVDIFVDGLGKNISRPIVVEANDDLFSYKPPQKRRKSVHVIEDVKITSRKKPSGDSVGKEVNLSAKSPLEELYASEQKSYTMRKLENNDRIHEDKVTKKAESLVKKEVKRARTTIEKDALAAPCSSNSEDYLQPPVYHEVPSTPNRAEYDALMDYSLVLSGTKRAAGSDEENPTKKPKSDNCKEILSKINVEEFLNMVHNK